MRAYVKQMANERSHPRVHIIVVSKQVLGPGRGCVKKKYTTCFLIGFKGLICLKWLHMTGSGQNRVDIDHTL